MNSLKMHIHNMKCIKDLDIELPLESGLYAIAGLNGSGKSTIVASASCAFFFPKMNEYFGPTDKDSQISLEYNDAHIICHKDNMNKWQKEQKSPFFGINGFYEGSLMFGNRFRDTSFSKILALERTPQQQLNQADEFIRESLGEILQGDNRYYEKLYYLENKNSFSGIIYFYEKEGKRVSQFHMSTGECLLLSILTSIYHKTQDRSSTDTPYLMLLDEVEMALHPMSLHRLLDFLNEIAEQFNMAIYFSTHSLEIIGRIPSERIFFIRQMPDGQSDLTNPCSSCYATRSLYTLDGYDTLICVEDILAKTILERVITKEQLRSGKLVFISPIGGYANVLDYAYDAIKYKLCGIRTSICCVIDGDVKEEAINYIHNKRYGSLPVNYLPIESLEKYLLKNLVTHVDIKLYHLLHDYIFQQTDLSSIIHNYQLKTRSVEDKDGKILWNMLEKELNRINVSKEMLVEKIWGYLENNDKEKIQKITEFLRVQLEN